MKKIFFTAALIAFLTVMYAGYGLKVVNKNLVTVKSDSGFAVVELFTSEGCSSCPPADKAVANLLSKNNDNIYILSYHVDYWNRLGWKDIFSKAEFSERQKRYASHLSLESVYTPQVIVNGSTEFVGSDENKLNTSISNGLKNKGNSDLSISSSKANNIVTIFYDINEQNIVILNIALVQPEATSSVKRGENGGKVLHHINIVREFKTVDAKGKGRISIEIPNELSGTMLELIAFTQAKNNFHILGAAKKVLPI
ncbi:MAG: DUF1223 domain-containing protein [Chitinophagaceae bacterium]